MEGATSVGGAGLGRASCRFPSERDARRGMSTLCPFLGEEVGFFIGIKLYLTNETLSTRAFVEIPPSPCDRAAPRRVNAG